MKRYLTMLAFLTALMAAPASFSNVVFTVSTSVTNGHTLNDITPGDIVTLGIRLSNDSPSDYIVAVGAAVMGYDASSVEFVDGQSATTSLFCTNPACTNGLISTFDNTTPLVEQVSPSLGRFVQFVSAFTIGPRNGDGLNDPGIDGVVGGGDAEFRVRFRYLGGLASFDIGTTTDVTIGNVIGIVDAPVNGVFSSRQGVNASLIFPVPEPNTAMLIGLGLAGLGAATKRR